MFADLDLGNGSDGFANGVLGEVIQESLASRYDEHDPAKTFLCGIPEHIFHSYDLADPPETMRRIHATIDRWKAQGRLTVPAA